VEHLPTAGEIVFFDRSWYNRAGVEKVMGFCTDEQYEAFFRQVPEFERLLVDDGIALLGKWDAYTAAKVTMFQRTDTPGAPWTVIKSNDKKRARLEAIRSLLSGIDYDRKDPQIVGQPDPLIVGAPAGTRQPVSCTSRWWR
jgi:polyphosphate kinase